MDKRYKSLTPADQLTARRQLFQHIQRNPGMPLPEVLTYIRKSLRLTTPELARISGVSSRFILDTIAGKGNPSLETASSLLRPFGLSIGVTVAQPKELSDPATSTTDNA